jgi:hypothetical protein
MFRTGSLDIILSFQTDDCRTMRAGNSLLQISGGKFDMPMAQHTGYLQEFIQDGLRIVVGSNKLLSISIHASIDFFR